MSIGPPVFNCNVLTLDVASFLETFLESGELGCERICGLRIQEPDNRNQLLLPARHQRPRRRTSKPRDERPPFHSITLFEAGEKRRGTAKPIGEIAERCRSRPSFSFFSNASLGNFESKRRYREMLFLRFLSECFEELS